MIKQLGVLLFVCLISCVSYAQITPKEGSSLNYRLIGFSFPPQLKTTKYKIEIAAGNYYNIDSFRKNIVKSAEADTNRLIAEVPSFGQCYTWRTVCIGQHPVNSELHHFNTRMNPKVDTAMNRLRIIGAAKQYKDAYVFVDGLQALYDMKGNAVWFLPDSSCSVSGNAAAADMKLSPQGTITFISDNAYEVNYDGAILWKGPNTGAISNDTIEHYHHELTRLANGHYMVMGTEMVLWKVPDHSGDPLRANRNAVKEADSSFYRKVPFGTLIEYNEQGRVVWYWRSSVYFQEMHFLDHKMLHGMANTMDVHENSFFFNEKTNEFYVSFKNISTIIKAKYPEGTVLAVYDGLGKTDSTKLAGALFSGQHSVKISQDGRLYLFNNNAAADGFPTLLMMREPSTAEKNLEKVWEYAFTAAKMTGAEQAHYNEQIRGRPKNLLRMHFTSGGNVMELPGHSIFASMNSPVSRAFIVALDKEILWSAIPEQKRAGDTSWNEASTYRCSIIANRKDMERLVWNAQ